MLRLERTGRRTVIAMAVGAIVLLTVWAKSSGFGLWVLATVFVVSFGYCAVIRWREGHWPGDEGRANLTAEQRRRIDRRGYVGIAVLIALCIVLAIYVQSHTR